VSRAEGLLHRTEHWIFAAEDARRLAAIRIGLCSLLALRLSTRDYDAVAARHAHFLPHFYMDAFAQMPSPQFISAVQICGIAAALAAAAGLVLGATLPLAVTCSLVLNGILNSAGRVIVGDAVLILCLLVLVACGRAAGDAWSLRAPARTAKSERYGWPIRTAMAAIALAYFFAGFQKWRYSGIEWVTSDNLRWILYGQSHRNGWALFVADRPLLAHVLAAGSLLLETCFPLVLFFRRLRWVFIPAAVAMHVGVRLAIGLDYSAQWLTLVIVFVDWAVVTDWLRRSVERVPSPREAPS
jgi:hypothetical protein